VSKLLAFDKPDDGDKDHLRTWLVGDRGGEGFLKDMEAYTWEESSDLFALRPRDPDEERDAFSRLLSTTVLNLYHKYWGENHRVRQPH
jgi:hypothetical protein